MRARFPSIWITLLLLTIAAVINAAAALAIAHYQRLPSGPDQIQSLSTDQAQKLWRKYAPASWHGISAKLDKFSRGALLGRSWTQITSVAADSDNQIRGIEIAQYGLPFRALESVALQTWATNPIRRTSIEYVRCLRLKPDPPWVEHVLPLGPVWPGFIANTMLYAAAIWFLLELPVQIRRRVRLKRGLCPACAYPIGTSANCSECGALLPRNIEAGQRSAR